MNLDELPSVHYCGELSPYHGNFPDGRKEQTRPQRSGKLRRQIRCVKPAYLRDRQAAPSVTCQRWESRNQHSQRKDWQ